MSELAELSKELYMRARTFHLVYCGDEPEGERWSVSLDGAFEGYVKDGVILHPRAHPKPPYSLVLSREGYIGHGATPEEALKRAIEAVKGKP